MDPINLEQIYAEYPQLEDIALRLQHSYEEAEKKNKEKKLTRNDLPAEGQASRRPRHVSATCEHAFIEKFYNGSRWEKTYHVPLPGRENFETNLQRIFARKPQAIVIVIVNGAKINASTKSEKIQIVLKKDAEIPEEPKNNDSEVINTISSMLGELKETAQKQPAITTDPKGELSLANLSYAQKLTEIEHKYEIETLKRDHRYEIDKLHDEYEKQIDDLNEEIDALNEEIEELESEKVQTEANLNGIDEKIKKAQNPGYIDLAGKILANAATNLMKNHTKGLAQLGGVSEEKLIEYFKDFDDNGEKIEKESPNGNEASFSFSSNSQQATGPYASLDADRKQIVDAFIDIASDNSIDHLKMLIGAFKYALNEDGTINMKAVGLMFNTGRQAAEAAKATQTTETSETNN